MDWVKLENRAYWVCFIAVFLAIAVWESFHPHRGLSVPAERRWKNHGLLLAITAVGGALLLRVSPLVAAGLAAGNRYGVLNKPWLPLWLRCALTVLALDLVQYWIHWSMHHVPWLWRMHEVHHSDPDYDVSTAGRFHPLEELYSDGIRLGIIVLLAAPLAGVFLAELLSAALNLAVHANASLPRGAENVVRTILITPDLHRVHHSEDAAEQQLNFGQTFPWWDRLFGTYARSERSNAVGFKTGLKGLDGYDRMGLGFLLAEPFRAVEMPAVVHARENPEPGPDPLA